MNKMAEPSKGLCPAFSRLIHPVYPVYHVECLLLAWAPESVLHDAINLTYAVDSIWLSRAAQRI